MIYIYDGFVCIDQTISMFVYINIDAHEGV